MDAITLQAAIIFALLAHPDFNVRERAAIPPHVAAIGIFHDDPEVACRCERAARVHAFAHVEQVLAALKPANGWPWCDGVRGVDWSGFLQAGRDGTPPEQHGPDGGWGEYRTATILWLRNEVLLGTSVSRLRELLAEMTDAEAKWWKAHPPRQE